MTKKLNLKLTSYDIWLQITLKHKILNYLFTFARKIYINTNSKKQINFFIYKYSYIIYFYWYILKYTSLYFLIQNHIKNTKKSHPPQQPIIGWWERSCRPLSTTAEKIRAKLSRESAVRSWNRPNNGFFNPVRENWPVRPSMYKTRLRPKGRQNILLYIL